MSERVIFKSGNFFNSKAQVLICPVGCKGVMDLGIANLFKKKYPNCFEPYRTLCFQNKLRVGKVPWKKFDEFRYPEYILYFPIKKYFEEVPKLDYIKVGINQVLSFCMTYRIKSVAVPALGCEFGGLDWEKDIKPLFRSSLQSSPDTDFLCYGPTN